MSAAGRSLSSRIAQVNAQKADHLRIVQTAGNDLEHRRFSKLALTCRGQAAAHGMKHHDRMTRTARGDRTTRRLANVRYSPNSRHALRLTFGKKAKNRRGLSFMI